MIKTIKQFRKNLDVSMIKKLSCDFVGDLNYKTSNFAVKNPVNFLKQLAHFKGQRYNSYISVYVMMTEWNIITHTHTHTENTQPEILTNYTCHQQNTNSNSWYSHTQTCNEKESHYYYSSTIDFSGRPFLTDISTFIIFLTLSELIMAPSGVFIT